MSLPRIFFSGWTFVGKEKAQLSPVKLPSCQRFEDDLYHLKTFGKIFGF